MTPVEQQLQVLKTICPGATLTRLPSGAHLVTMPDVKMPPGWNRQSVTILFVAPPAYPAAQPDCFWVEPTGVRLENGTTPQNTNDANAIPEVGQRGTWFSWIFSTGIPRRLVGDLFQSDNARSQARSMIELVLAADDSAAIRAELTGGETENCAILDASQTVRADGTLRLLAREIQYPEEAD